MRIAIFGGTGFVGFNLIEFLSEKNIKINALVRSGSEHKILKNNNKASIRTKENRRHTFNPTKQVAHLAK